MPQACAGGFAMMARRALSWFIDWALCAGLVSVFYFCAGVFYLEESTVTQGNLMLVCAVVSVALLTVWLPLQGTGQTLGERACRLQVANRDGRARGALQLFVRECVLKVACGPFLAVFCLLDYAILGLVIHRDPDHELLLDYFLKTRVIRAGGK